MTDTHRPARVCAPCRHARSVASVLLFAVLVVVASWYGGAARGAVHERPGDLHVPQPAPEPASAAAEPPPVAASVAASAAVAASAPGGPSPLLLRTVPLRAARVGEDYKPLRLVRDPALLPFVRLEGSLPPGMVLGDDGQLRGTPTRTGLFEFHMDVADPASSRPVHQAYSLRVQVPARPAPVAASAARPAASPVLGSLGPDESAALVDLHKETPLSYKLTAADLATVLPGDDAASTPDNAAAAANAPPAPASGAAVVTDVAEAAGRPTVEQLRAQLAPLVDVEFPTRPLFEQAIAAGRCGYYRAHVEEQARRRGLAADPSCPPAGPPPARVPAGHVSLRQFYDALLPADLHDQLVALAEKRHPIESARPLVLVDSGCGCHVGRQDETVYGLIPFWLATDDAQDVDVGLYSRIEFLGAMLKDDGSLAVPVGWNGQPGGFARTALRHGADVDLVVYRRDWSALLAQTDARLEEFARAAARNAVLMADTRFDDATSRWLQPLLLPAWRDREQVYGGVTVFFDDTTVEPSRRAAFKRFYRSFALRLIQEMAAVGRKYQLNFVVPDAELGDDDGAYGFEQLADYMETAQPRPQDENADEQTRRRYRGKTDITVQYLVTLGAPTGAARLALRQRVDSAQMLHDYRGTLFLKGVVPLLFGVRSDKAVPASPELLQQVHDDLSYIRWTFGGAAMWPAPVPGLGQGAELHDALAGNYRPPSTSAFDVCAIVCPNRLLLRLLVEVALALDLLAISAYGWSCSLRRAVGRRLLLVIWGAGLATLAASGVFFGCDPLFVELRAGNVPLYALVGLLCLAGAYATLRPRVEAP